MENFNISKPTLTALASYPTHLIVTKQCLMRCRARFEFLDYPNQNSFSSKHCTATFFAFQHSLRRITAKASANYVYHEIGSQCLQRFEDLSDLHISYWNVWGGLNSWLSYTQLNRKNLVLTFPPESWVDC